MHTNVALPMADTPGPKHPPLGPLGHVEVPGTLRALVTKNPRRPTFGTAQGYHPH